VDEDLSLIEQTKRLITRVDVMQQAARDLRAELMRYGQALQQQLAALQEAVDGSVDTSEETPIPPVESESAKPDRAAAPPQSTSRELEQGPKTPLRIPRPSPGAIRDALEAPAAPAVKPRPDRRQSVRREGPPVPIYLSYSKNGEDPFKGWVNDCSQTGLGVTVEWALPVSSILTVRPVNAPARLRWFQVEVRNCRKNKDRWHLGCKFLQQLPAEDLELFEPWR
jgi:hypothetical protein